MNIKEYISSGIIESYVLGLASPEERAEFESLCLQYRELIEARNEFEILLEKELTAGTIVPGEVTRKNILEAINEPVGRQTKVISMEKENTPASGGWLRMAAAASVILLLVSAYFSYNFYSRNKKLENQTSELQARLDSTRSIIDQMVNEQKMMSDPNVTVVSLVGTEKRTSADVYWDSTSANVFMVVKNMPQLPSDKQYQLWALIDGKPVDLGLFDGGREKFMLKMNNAQKADAFAITIENRGNTGKPNLDQLQAMTKLRL